MSFHAQNSISCLNATCAIQMNLIPEIQLTIFLVPHLFPFLGLCNRGSNVVEYWINEANNYPHATNYCTNSGQYWEIERHVCTLLQNVQKTCLTLLYESPLQIYHTWKKHLFWSISCHLTIPGNSRWSEFKSITVWWYVAEYWFVSIISPLAFSYVVGTTWMKYICWPIPGMYEFANCPNYQSLQISARLEGFAY